MASESLNKVVQHLRSLSDRSAPSITDRQLLESFAHQHDETAFSTLMNRHGPLVLGVCRRILNQEADAEDAFQATFLVLAKKAGAVSWQESVGNWLYGVAYRIAHKLRVARSRRQHHEQMAVQQKTHEASADAWNEIQAVLDEELQKLPTRFRIPLVLCYLEGRTQDEAAKQLGWSLGSFRGRLWRGRDLLRDRLAKRGLPLAAVLVALALSPRAVPAAVPGMLAPNTIQAALSFAAGRTADISLAILALTKGLLHSMFLSKLQTVSAVLAVLVLVTGLGVMTHQVLADKPVVLAQAPEDKPKDDDKPKEGPQEAEKPKDDDKPKEGPKDGVKPKEGPKDGDKPKEGPRDRGPGIRGTIKEVQAQQKSLTVVSTKEEGGGGGAEATIDASSAKIAVAGRAAEVNDLQPGMTVFVPLGNGLKVAGVIEAWWPTIGGTVQSVDIANNSLTLVVDQPQDRDRPKGPGAGGDKRTSKAFVLVKDTPITVSGIPVLLSDLEPKTCYVTLDMAVDGKTPSAVRAKVVQGYLHGYVTAIDAGKSTITLLLGGLNGPGAELTLDVAKDASILRHGKPDKLGELVLQSSALVKLGADKRSAVVIRTAFPIMRSGPEDR